MRLLSALVLCTALSSPVFAQEFSEPGLISIDGHGEVVVAPDTAFVTSGVTTQGATAKEALDANTAAMGELIQTLKDAGIEARDIQTSGFSVNPNYVYTDARDANGYQLPPKINGYQVYNTVNVRVRKLDTLGAVLDKAVTVGANTINGVTFSVSDTSDILNEARKQALEDAREKAELYATAAGVELGHLRSITETQNMGGPIPYAAADMAYARAEAAPVPVEGGELTYSINVSVSWALDQAD
ncbi:MAG TPA: SIMPL domain-containing protein [Devosia sp.]